MKVLNSKLETLNKFEMTNSKLQLLGFRYSNLDIATGGSI